VASAPDIVRKLIEGIDDPEDLDSPETFDVAGHIESPVARLASTNGFTRVDRHEGEERWVKKLRNGQEAWLRTTTSREFEAPMDMRDPRRHGGREWEFVLVKPAVKCDYCNQDRPAKKGVCPNCRKSSKQVRWQDHSQIARGNEVTMSYLLGAVLQRLATWPENLPKPGQPGWKKAFESLGVDDPDDMLRHLKAQEGCPHCGCPEYDRGTAFATPTGHTVQNLICKKCGRYYCRGEEKTRIVPD
jgi:hypothetical protein